MIDVVFLLLVFFICASVGSTADKLLPAELNGNSTSSIEAVATVEPEEWEHPPVQIRIEPSAAGNHASGCGFSGHQNLCAPAAEDIFRFCGNHP